MRPLTAAERRVARNIKIDPSVTPLPDPEQAQEWEEWQARQNPEHLAHLQAELTRIFRGSKSNLALDQVHAQWLRQGACYLPSSEVQLDAFFPVSPEPEPPVRPQKSGGGSRWDHGVRLGPVNVPWPPPGPEEIP